MEEIHGKLIHNQEVYADRLTGTLFRRESADGAEWLGHLILPPGTRVPEGDGPFRLALADGREGTIVLRPEQRGSGPCLLHFRGRGPLRVPHPQADPTSRLPAAPDEARLSAVRGE